VVAEAHKERDQKSLKTRSPKSDEERKRCSRAEDRGHDEGSEQEEMQDADIFLFSGAYSSNFSRPSFVQQLELEVGGTS
jgi:hypothetical protein